MEAEEEVRAAGAVCQGWGPAVTHPAASVSLSVPQGGLDFAVPLTLNCCSRCCLSLHISIVSHTCLPLGLPFPLWGWRSREQMAF